MKPVLKNRVTSGVLMGAVLIAVAIWAPVSVIVLVIMALCAILMWEFFALLDAAGMPSHRTLGLLGGLTLIGGTGYRLITTHGLDHSMEPLIIFGYLLAIAVALLPRANDKEAIKVLAGSVLAFLYIAFLLNFITKLLLGWPLQDGRLLIIYMIAVVKFTDIGAYFIGCAVGRHKFMPSISPAKTWEGCIGGMLVAVLVSLTFWLICKGDLGVISLSALEALVMGVILAATGICGDLIESFFKRAAGVKDSGASIKGMGGALDVVDSLLLAAPVMYFAANYFFVNL